MHELKLIGKSGRQEFKSGGSVHSQVHTNLGGRPTPDVDGPLLQVAVKKTCKWN